MTSWESATRGTGEEEQERESTKFERRIWKKEATTVHDISSCVCDGKSECGGKAKKLITKTRVPLCLLEFGLSDGTKP